MTKSKKMSNTRQKFDFRMKPKMNLNNTSSQMLLDHCYAFGLMLEPFVLKKKSFEEGDPHDLFWPRPGSAPGRIWPKNNNTCKGP